MAKVTMERATVAHAHELAPRMRAADVAEVQASGGFAPLDALLASLEGSSEAYALRFDGELAAIWGVEPKRLTLVGPVRLGIVWALTSDTVDRHPTAFGRASRKILSVLLDEYPALVNAVDARYTQALEWVQALGFAVYPAEPFGVEGRLFHRIEIHRGMTCANQ